MGFWKVFRCFSEPFTVRQEEELSRYYLQPSRGSKHAFVSYYLPTTCDTCAVSLGAESCGVGKAAFRFGLDKRRAECGRTVVSHKHVCVESGHPKKQLTNSTSSVKQWRVSVSSILLRILQKHSLPTKRTERSKV